MTEKTFFLNQSALTLRDSSIKKLYDEKPVKVLKEIKKLKTVIFAAPTPSKPGEICGAFGPTTAGRMQPFFKFLISCGVNLFIGKGAISSETSALLKKNNAVYAVTYSGVAAYLNQFITSCEKFYFKELGAESILKITFKNFPIRRDGGCNCCNFYKNLIRR